MYLGFFLYYNEMNGIDNLYYLAMSPCHSTPQIGPLG